MTFPARLALIPLLLFSGLRCQEQGSAKPALLSATEQASLRDKLAKFLQDDAAYSLSTGRERERAARAREKSQEAFDEAWRKAEAKGNVLGSPADLRAIFDNCFLLKAPSVTLGSLRKEVIKEDGLEYHFFLPKSYKERVPTRTVLMLPGTADGGTTWVKAPEHFSATWEKAPLAADTIFHLPVPPANLELDPVPDWTREGADAEEQRRINMVWRTFAEVMLTYNVDRSRILLDSGRGTCGFALRFLTMFPDRFAGVVLRQPVAVDDIRLGTLSAMPVLLLRSQANAQVVDALHKRFEEIGNTQVTVLDAADEYPHREATAAIEAWLKERRRVFLPQRVVIEPNHDRFNRAYWAKIDVADLLATALPDKKPRLEVTADRTANRLTVKTVGVERFTLFLSDELIDLDKEFTVLINDKAITEKRTRSFRDLRERMIARNDWECLFPAVFTASVPKQ